MTKKEKELTEEQINSFVEGAQALAGWHELNVIKAVATGTKEKWDTMLKDIGNGKEKNNNFNKGYMKALLDIYYSLQVMINNKDLENKLAEQEEENTQTEGETNE